MARKDMLNIQDEYILQEYQKLQKAYIKACDDLSKRITKLTFVKGTTMFKEESIYTSRELQDMYLKEVEEDINLESKKGTKGFIKVVKGEHE